MNDFNITGATIVIMQGDSVLHLKGYGLANVESNTAVNGDSSIFRIASISKTFVATAIMQLYEDGKLELDRDVNNYLSSFQLKYKFNDSITIRNLLTHTAGFDLNDIGTSVRIEKEVIPLARHLKERMPVQIRPSGKIIGYSNQGYALLGLIAEEVSGMPFHEYVGKRILEPLEMNSSSFKPQAKLKEHYVTSYLQKGGQLIPYKPEYPLNYPAGGLDATASDMGNFISMFLNNGNFKGRQILDSTSVYKMYHTPFKLYEKAEYGWSLGLYDFNWNGIKYYAHEGAIQGFVSQLSLFPKKNIGFYICTNSSGFPHGNSRVFINQYADRLLTLLIPQEHDKKQQEKIALKSGTVDKPLERFAGAYRSTHYGHTTFSKLGVLIGLAPEITIVSQDSTLKIPEWNLELRPISDLTFHSNFGYLAFDRNTEGEISHFFGQTYSYQKLKWYEPVKFQMLWIGSIILILLSYITVSAVRRLFIRNIKCHSIKYLNFSLASSILLSIVILAYGLMTTDTMELPYGVPLLIKITLVMPFIIIPLELVTIYLLTKTIRSKELGTLDLIYQTVIVITSLLFIPLLTYYNLIGFNY